MHFVRKPSPAAIVRWTARLTGLLLFFFWGAFFVEHLVEWFSDFSHQPPTWVLVGQIFHGLMLVGFIVAWKWELPGALMIVVFSSLFFLKIVGWGALVFLLITIIPAILHAIAWALSRNAGKGANTPLREAGR
jgi:hypothetical protein